MQRWIHAMTREDDHKSPRPLIRSTKREGSREASEQGGWYKVRPDEARPDADAHHHV